MSCSTTICTPSYSVPGPRGQEGADGSNGANGSPAFTTLDGSFLMPDEGDTVVVDVLDNTWIVVGQILYIQSAGFLVASAVNANGTGLTLLNPADAVNGIYPDNATPGVSIPDQSKVSPGGVQGPEGAPGAPGTPGTAGSAGDPGSNAFTATTADFVQPAVGNNVTIAVEDSQAFGIGENLFVVGAGWYEVITIPDSTHIQLQNLGYPGSAAPATNISDPAKVTPSGVRGATGATGSTGPAGTLSDLFRAVKNGVNQSIADTVPTKVTFSTELLDNDNVWDTSNSQFVAPADGVYLLFVQISLLSNVEFNLDVYKNGGFGVGTIVWGWDNSGSGTSIPIATVPLPPLELALADTIEFWLTQSSGGAVNVKGSNSLTSVWGFRVA